MMLGVEQFAALGVVFMVLIVVFIAMTLLVTLKEIVKEKVNWWRRKWRMEIKLEELERRVGSLEEMNEIREEGEADEA